MDKIVASLIGSLLFAGALALTGCAQDTNTTAPGTPPVFGSGPGNPPPGGGNPSPTGNRIQLSVSAGQLPSSGAATVDVTAVVLDVNGQTVPGNTVTFSTGTDLTAFISNISGGGVADANGVVTGKLNVGADKSNRTVTISAAAAGATNLVPVQIVGSTVAMNASGTTLPDTGVSPVTLTVTAKDSANNPVSNAAVTLTKTGAGNVTFTPAATGTTNGSGQFVVTVAGAAGGAVTVTASAVGATAVTNFTVTSAAANFSIDQTTNGAVVTLNPTAVAMKIGDSLVVQVNAPAPAASVTFVTTQGSWNGGGTSANVAVAGGKASATLTAAQAGVANVQVFDPAATGNNDSLTVSITAAVANSITLQATPSVVATSVGTTTGVSTLVATVSDPSGQPVGDVPVAFSIVNPTGGGETLSPVVSFSAAVAAGGLGLGQARTTFTSGSLPSAAGGIKIRASVLGTGVATNSAPSGNDAGIVIGGRAGSVAFGQATVLAEANNATNYVLAMSVLVADVNGSPAPAGTVVNLSAWPIAWSTGVACFFDADNGTNKGTFLNEDANENLVLDPVEDGARVFYANKAAVAGGTKDGIATPSNSAGGIVPGTLTTDANGVATFNLTYGKTSAIWIVTRIRARTVVQGTEAVSEIQFRLPALQSDVGPPCRLPDSPYFF